MIPHFVIKYLIIYFWMKTYEQLSAMRDHTCGFACFSPLITNAVYDCRPFAKVRAFD